MGRAARSRWPTPKRWAPRRWPITTPPTGPPREEHGHETNPAVLRGAARRRRAGRILAGLAQAAGALDHQRDRHRHHDGDPDLHGAVGHVLELRAAAEHAGAE